MLCRNQDTLASWCHHDQLSVQGRDTSGSLTHMWTRLRQSRMVSQLQQFLQYGHNTGSHYFTFLLAASTCCWMVRWQVLPNTLSICNNGIEGDIARICAHIQWNPVFTAIHEELMVTTVFTGSGVFATTHWRLKAALHYRHSTCWKVHLTLGGCTHHTCNLLNTIQSFIPLLASSSLAAMLYPLCRMRGHINSHLTAQLFNIAPVAFISLCMEIDVECILLLLVQYDVVQKPAFLQSVCV